MIVFLNVVTKAIREQRSNLKLNLTSRINNVYDDSVMIYQKCFIFFFPSFCKIKVALIMTSVICPVPVGPVKISPAVPEITLNKQTDRRTKVYLKAFVLKFYH